MLKWQWTDHTAAERTTAWGTRILSRDHVLVNVMWDPGPDGVTIYARWLAIAACSEESIAAANKKRGL